MSAVADGAAVRFLLTAAAMVQRPDLFGAVVVNELVIYVLVNILVKQKMM